MWAVVLATSPLCVPALAQNVAEQAGEAQTRMRNGVVVTGIVVGDPADGMMLVRARNGVFYGCDRITGSTSKKSVAATVCVLLGN